MKKAILSFIAGAGIVYLSLSLKPGLLVTISVSASDSTAVKADSAKAVPELSPAPETHDTTATDTTKK
jgi:hypothetical protein